MPTFSQPNGLTISFPDEPITIPPIQDTVGYLAPIILYVDKNGNDSNNGLTLAAAFLTIQKAIDSLPSNIINDVLIKVGYGTFIEHGGSDEWGRTLGLNFYGKNIKPKRALDNLDITKKAGKITIIGTKDTNGVLYTFLDGDNKGIRSGIYAHNQQNIYVRDIVIQNYSNGIVSHEGGDVTLNNTILKSNDYGAVVENGSKIEIAYSTIQENNIGIYLKNGQLQINNSNLVDNTTNFLRIEGSTYAIIEDCIGNGLPAGDFILSKGCMYLRIKGGEYTGGFNFIKGSVAHLEVNSTPYISGFTNSVLLPQAGFWDITGAHIFNNGFVMYQTEGNPCIRMTSCDSKNKEGVDTPNTQGTPIRMLGGGVLQTSGTTILPYKVLYTPPLDNPILWGTTPPVSGYHFKGKVMFNTNVSEGGIYGWICITAGTPGVWRGLTINDLVQALACPDIETPNANVQGGTYNQVDAQSIATLVNAIKTDLADLKSKLRTANILGV